MSWFGFKRRSYETVGLKHTSLRQRDTPSVTTLLLKSTMGQAGSVNFQEKELDVFRGSDQPILHCEIGPDGKVLAACSADSRVYIWKLPTETEPGELLQTLEGHKQEVTSCSFSGPILASSSTDGQVILWLYKKGKRASRIAVHSGAVYDCLFSNNGQSLASASKDTTIRRFKIKPGAGEFVPGLDTRTLTGRYGHFHAVTALAFTPDDNFIISGAEDGVINKWSRSEGQCVESQNTRYGPVKSIKFPVRYPPAEEIFATLSGSSIVIWNYRDSKMEIKEVLDAERKQILAISFIPGSSILVGTSYDNCLCWWNLNPAQGATSNLRPTVVPMTHQGHIQCCCFDPQGHYFITGDSSGYVKIWY